MKKLIHPLVMGWFASFVYVAPSLAQPGSLDQSFGGYPPGADQTLFSIAVQTNGKVILAGAFTNINSMPRDRIARLNVDGSLDMSFDANFSRTNDFVAAVALQSDGKILIGGEFTNVNGEPRNYIARLNSNGSLDQTFGNGLSGANETVLTIVPLASGKILVGGSFWLMNGVTNCRIARLNSDGSTDTSFAAGLNVFGTVRSIAVQSDGKILVGGCFPSINGATPARIARLNEDGSPDTTFASGLAGADDCVYAVSIQADGKVLIGGWFTTVNGVSRMKMARLNCDGSLDTGFRSDASSTVNCIQPLSDGRAIIAGRFSYVNSQAWELFARTGTNGALDKTFGYSTNVLGNSVECMALQPDGKLLIGGSITSVGGLIRNRIARLNPDGTRDPTFMPDLSGPNAAVYSVTVQANGALLLGGYFSTIHGRKQCGIGRITPDGHLDTDFGVNALPRYSLVYVATTQPDGKVILGGSSLLKRLNADGSADSTFNVGAIGTSDTVHSIGIQSDGKIVVGGGFFPIQGVSSPDIARLNPDGSVDQTFNAGTADRYGEVRSVVLQTDGKVIVGTLAGGGISRLNANGVPDPDFCAGLSGANYPVETVALQPDGKIVIGGSFSQIHGETRQRIARLHPDGSLDTNFAGGIVGAGWVEAISIQPDGRVLIGGSFTNVNGVTRNRIARLEADGTLDLTFVPDVTTQGSSVYSICLQSDGRVWVGGTFTDVQGVPRRYLARLHGDRPPLGFAMFDANAIFSWPVGWTGFVAQSTMHLDDSWHDIPETIASDGTNWILSVLATNMSRCFRLRR